MTEPRRADWPGSPFDGAEFLSIYTRADAIDDGSLVDVTTTAQEAGFRFPVALTRAAWVECVQWEQGGAQSESGRLWDVLFTASIAGRVQRTDTDRVAFQVLRSANERGQRQGRVELVAHCGPGDTAEPVITIMLPGES